VGELLRTHPHHFEEGVVIVEEALRLAEEHGAPRKLAVVQLRLAIALQYAGHQNAALGHFESANDTIREARLPGLPDFVEQHRGKCLVELGRFEDVRRALKAALRLRTRRRSPDPGLVASTRKALHARPAAQRRANSQPALGARGSEGGGIHPKAEVADGVALAPRVAQLARLSP